MAGKVAVNPCGALLKRCVKHGCRYRFTKSDTASGVTVCPECGTPRRTCRNPPVPGGARCKKHAGLSLRGIASPTYRGRGYSKFLPPRMASDYADALADPELIELRREIALTEARTIDLLKRIDSLEAGQSWRALRETTLGLGMALKLGDRKGQDSQLAALLKLIEGGLSDYAVWGEIGALLESKRRLVETEQKRLVNLRAYITLEQSYLFFDAIVRAVTQHVTDPATLNAIQTDWSAVLSRADQSVLAGGDRRAE